MATDPLDPSGRSADPGDRVLRSPYLIRARIQAHPSRSHLHHALVSALELPSEVVLHSSDPPSPWAGYLECLRDPPPCTHLLVIQDDAIPCKNFASALRLIAQDVPVCLYVGGHSRQTAREMTRAHDLGLRYCPIWWREFCPVVAMLWPVEKIREFLPWAEKAKLPGDPNPRSDDSVIGYWMRKTHQTILATVPSLVQHDDREPSVKRGPGQRRPQDSARPAHLLADDALRYDWTPSESVLYTRTARRQRS